MVSNNGHQQKVTPNPSKQEIRVSWEVQIVDDTQWEDFFFGGGEGDLVFG